MRAGSDGINGRFITGMSRAGTNWLSRTLNEHPESVVFGESMFWGRQYMPPGPGGLYSLQQLREIAERARSWIREFSGSSRGSYKVITEEDANWLFRDALLGTDSMRPGEAFSAIGNSLARAEGKRVWIEKTPHHVNWIDRIMATFAGARFVVLVRQPFSFMLSYKHQGDRKPEGPRRHFRALYHPAGCAFIWRRYAQAAWRAARRYPENVLVVEFEEMTVDPEGSLRRIERHFGLQEGIAEGRDVPRNSSFPSGQRPELEAADIVWMRLVASGHFWITGAPRQSVPRPWRGFLWSILVLPFWAARAARTLLKMSSAASYILKWLGL